MENTKAVYSIRIMVIVAEVFIIGLLGYSITGLLPDETGSFLSLDVLYCIPVIQTARLASIHGLRHHDMLVSTIAAIVVAVIWSLAEAIIAWQYFPKPILLLNMFTRSVVFTVVGRVLVKLWRDKKYARIDVLTGLDNRLELLDRLTKEQRRSERSRKPYSLLFIDIDHFKKLNDKHGHHIGDEALKVLADILRSCSRTVDVVARLGGDEFVVLLPDTDEASCETLIHRIEASSNQAFAERSWSLSISIGRTTNMGNNNTVEQVIKLADENMYAIKKNSKLQMQPVVP